MKVSGWERLSAATGLAFVILIVGGLAILFSGGQPPDDPAQRLAFVSASKSRIGASAFLLALAAICFLWFSASLRRVLLRAENESSHLSLLAFTGGVIYAVFLLLSSFFLEQMVVAATIDLNATAVQVLSNIAVDPVFFDAEWAFPSALLLWAGGLSIIRTRAVPRWLGWVTAALAVVLIASAGATYVGRRLVILLGLALFLLWVVAMSVVLMWGPRAIPRQTQGLPRPGPQAR